MGGDEAASSVIIRVLMRERGKRYHEGSTVWREKYKDAIIMLALKTEEEAMSQRTQAASRNWKGQGNTFPSRPTGRGAILMIPLF